MNIQFPSGIAAKRTQFIRGDEGPEPFPILRSLITAFISAFLRCFSFPTRWRRRRPSFPSHLAIVFRWNKYYLWLTETRSHVLNLRPIEGHSYPRIPGERAYPFRVTSIHLLFLNELDDNRHRQIEPSHCLENFLDEFNTSRESVFAYYWKSSPPPEKVSFFPTKKKLARAPLFILGSCFIVVPQRSLAGSIRSVHHKVLSFPPSSS